MAVDLGDYKEHVCTACGVVFECPNPDTCRLGEEATCGDCLHERLSEEDE